MTNPRTTVDIFAPEYFLAASGLYSEAGKEYQQAKASAIALRESLNATRDQLKAIEADVLANGGIGEAVIDGKNKETREAQLAQVLASHPPYCRAQGDLRSIETQMATADLRADDAANELSLQRRRMDACIAFVTLDAARLSGAIHNIGNGHRA